MAVITVIITPTAIAAVQMLNHHHLWGIVIALIAVAVTIVPILIMTPEAHEMMIPRVHIRRVKFRQPQ